METPQTPKKFFERPEGTTGIIFMIALGILGVVMLDRILPFIIRVMENTIYAMCLAGGIAMVVVLLLNNRFRTSMVALFQLAMRWLTGLVIEINPIGILKNYIDTLQKKLGAMEVHLGALKGQSTNLKRKISEKKAEMEHHLAQAEQYKKGNDALNMQLAARKAAREDETIKNFAVQLEKMELLYKILMSMRDKAKFLLEDTAHTVEIKESEYKSIKEAHSAMVGARALIAGESSQKDMFEQAMQFVADDVAMRIGEMDNFMQISKEILSGVDADMGILNDKGLKMLDEWEKKDSLLLGKDKQLLLNTTSTTAAPMSDSMAADKYFGN
jgi:hypothetical protein